MDQLLAALLGQIKAVVESPDFRAFLITLLTFGAAWLATQRARLKKRAEDEARVQTNRKQLEEQYEAQIKDIEVRRDQLITTMAQGYQAKVQELDAARLRFEAQTKDLESLRAEIEALKQREKTDQQEIARLTEDLRINTHSLKIKNDMIARLTAAQQATEKRIQALETDRNGWQKIAEERAKEVEDLKRELGERNGIIEDMKQQIDGMKKRIEGLEAIAKVEPPAEDPSPPEPSKDEGKSE